MADQGTGHIAGSGRPGLGARAHAAFGIPVIGVAKSRFATATHAVPVVRGTSGRPLFVTAAGMPRADAADVARRMAGWYRLPDALRRADTLARAGHPPPPWPTASPADLPRRAICGTNEHAGAGQSETAPHPFRDARRRVVEDRGRMASPCLCYGGHMVAGVDGSTVGTRLRLALAKRCRRGT